MRRRYRFQSAVWTLAIAIHSGLVWTGLKPTHVPIYLEIELKLSTTMHRYIVELILQNCRVRGSLVIQFWINVITFFSTYTPISISILDPYLVFHNSGCKAWAFCDLCSRYGLPAKSRMQLFSVGVILESSLSLHGRDSSCRGFFLVSVL